MRITLSRLGLLLGATALAVAGAAGTAAAAPAAPDSGTAAVGTSEAKTLPVQQRPSGAMASAQFNGYCEVFELCVFYGNGFTGSLVDFGGADASYHDNAYVAAGAGQGHIVANNSRSAGNADPYFFAITCIDPSYQGMCGYIAPYTGGDFLPDYFVNVESSYFTF